MPYVGFEPKSGWRNCLVELMLATYAAELGFTGADATPWFQGLFGGNTWHPPILVSEVGVLAGARVGAALWWAAEGAGVALTRAAVGDGRVGARTRGTSAVRPAPPPDGVGIDCAAGPLHAVSTISEDTRRVASRRPVAPARGRIMAASCPPPAIRS